MDVRQRTEEIELLTFAPWATFSDARAAAGRCRSRRTRCARCFSVTATGCCTARRSAA